MAGKRVAVLDADGNFGTLDEADIPNLPDGARVLTKQEIAAKKLEEDYAAKSTGEKVLGALAGRGIGPQSEAFLEGARGEFSAGIAPAASRVLRDVAAPGAGQAYAEHLTDLEEGAPTAFGGGRLAGAAAGVAVGMAGGGAAGAGAARAIPVNALSALGAPVEAGVGRALSGLASRGVLGQAASTGAKLAARGAVEGGAYAALSSTADSVLHDTPITGEKLFASMGHGALAGGVLGGALGTTGSLVASGARGAVNRLSKSAALVGEAGASVEGAALQKGARTLKSAIGDAVANPTDAAKRLSNELAFDALYTTKEQAAKLLERVPGGAGAVGEYVNRIAIRPAGGASDAVVGAAKAGFRGRADDLLPVIQADLRGRIIEGLSGEVRGTPARFPLKGLVEDATKTHQAMRADPARAAGADAFLSRIQTELGALERTPGRIAADGSIDAADAFYTRAALERGEYELGRSSKPARQAYKEFMRRWDDSVIETIDKAAAEAGSPGAGEKIRYWKREYQLAITAEKAAKLGAERATRNNIFGIREGIGAAVGLAMGHPIAGALALVGGKIARERGSAAGAYALGHLADSGAIARTVDKFNARLNDAAIGVLKEAPASRAAPARAALAPAKTSRAGAGPYREVAKREEEASREQAQAIVKWVGDTRANPTQLTEQLEEATAQISRSAGPAAAESYTGAALKAVNFIAAHIPAKERRDPLDPRSTPPLSREEADRLIRATKYAVQPESVFADFEKGIVTPEGLRAAQTFMPESFAEFQERLFDHVQEGMLRGRRLSDSQRLRIDKLLQSAAGPDLRPRSIRRLQADFAAPATGGPSPAPQTGGPVDLKVQQSGFDAVEARMMG